MFGTKVLLDCKFRGEAGRAPRALEGIADLKIQINQLLSLEPWRGDGYRRLYCSKFGKVQPTKAFPQFNVHENLKVFLI